MLTVIIVCFAAAVTIGLTWLATRQIAIDDNGCWRQTVDMMVEIHRTKARREASSKVRRRKAIRYGWRRPA